MSNPSSTEWGQAMEAPGADGGCSATVVHDDLIDGPKDIWTACTTFEGGLEERKKCKTWFEKRKTDPGATPPWAGIPDNLERNSEGKIKFPAWALQKAKDEFADFLGFIRRSRSRRDHPFFCVSRDVVLLSLCVPRHLSDQEDFDEDKIQCMLAPLQKLFIILFALIHCLEVGPLQWYISTTAKIKKEAEREVPEASASYTSWMVLERHSSEWFG